MAQPIEMPDGEMTHIEIYILLGGGAHEKVLVALDDLDPRLPSSELNEDIFRKGTLYARPYDIKNIPEGYLAVRLLLRMCVLSTHIQDIPLECWDERKPHVQDTKMAFEMAELFRDSYPNYPLDDQIRFIRAGGYNYGCDKMFSNGNLKHFQEIAPRFAPGKMMMGFIYLNGYGVPVDISRGMTLLHETSNGGLTKSTRAIGMYHLQASSALAVKSLRLASDNGNRTTKFDLAKHYKFANNKYCVKLFEELLTEVKGELLSFAMYHLAMIYINGTLAPVDTARGMRLMEQSSNLGCGSASHYIAMSMHEGRLWAANSALAFDYLQKASSNGIVVADYELGLCYFYGRGTQTDIVKGLELIRKAANGSNADALRFMAKFYLQKNLIPTDYGRAVSLLENLSKRNDKEGSYQLALLYAQGQGVPQNLSMAQEMLRKLVDQRFTAASYTLQIVGSQIALGNPLRVTQEIFPPVQAPPPLQVPPSVQVPPQRSVQEAVAIMTEQSKMAQKHAKIIHERLANAEAQSLQRVVHESRGNEGKRTADGQDAPAMKSGSPKRQIVEVDD